MIDRNFHSAIELIALTKRYRGVAVVDRLSLAVERGSTFGLIGPNGAGKSTAIKMMMGLTSIDSGNARVLGADVEADHELIKPHVGYVPELHHIYRWMRVIDVIAFVRSFYPSWNNELAGDLVTMFELPPGKRVRHLSKGMLAKLGLLLAVAHEPKLLVLDEPTSGLDPIVRQEFLDGVLKTICRGDQSVLFSSHAIDDVAKLVDTVGIMCQGRLLIKQPVDELLDSTKRIRAVLEDGFLPKLRPETTICERLDRREWLLTVREYSPRIVDSIQEHNPVLRVDVSDINLEEVFKDYIRGQKVAS